MKVHFIGDLSGNKKDYELIVSHIVDAGGELVTRHSLERSLDDLDYETAEQAELYARKMRNWIKRADIVVVEVTVPGLGAGYEVATAMDLGRPVIALYRKMGNNTPHVLRALESEDKLQVLSYNDDTLADVVKTAIEYASETTDTRFNFFISPKHQNYLDWVSKKRKIPRAVFLRRLIEAAMEKDEEYS